MLCPGAAVIIDLPITQAQRDSSSNTAIIRRMVRSDAMCRAFAAAYEVNSSQLTEPKVRTITHGMRQKVRLRLAALASWPGEACLRWSICPAGAGVWPVGLGP